MIADRMNIDEKRESERESPVRIALRLIPEDREKKAEEYSYQAEAYNSEDSSLLHVSFARCRLRH